MKISTKHYSDYKVGDLILYEEAHFNEDVGYIESVCDLFPNIIKVRWLKESAELKYTEETIQTLQSYNDSFVVPVSKQ